MAVRRLRNRTHLSHALHEFRKSRERTLNAALHNITKSRQRHHQPTIDYTQRRTTQGKTTAETTRSLKRYLARQLYRLMQNATPLTT